LQKERALWSGGQQDEQILSFQLATHKIIRFASCRWPVTRWHCATSRQTSTLQHSGTSHWIESKIWNFFQFRHTKSHSEIYVLEVVVSGSCGGLSFVCLQQQVILKWRLG